MLGIYKGVKSFQLAPGTPEGPDFKHHCLEGLPSLRLSIPSKAERFIPTMSHTPLPVYPTSSAVEASWALGKSVLQYVYPLEIQFRTHPFAIDPHRPENSDLCPPQISPDR